MTINDDILYKIDSEIGKDKKVVELQREIERLNQEIRCLNNFIIEFHSEFCNKQAEINRLNNIINELEKYCNEEIEDYDKHINSKFITDIAREQYEGEKVCFEDMLGKLQELKGSDK